MIVFEGVSAGRRPIFLSRIGVRWESGVHAVVGSTLDGARLVLSLVNGWTVPTKGTVKVLDGTPGAARIRRATACVFADATLPPFLRVDEVLQIGAALRGDAPVPAPEERLSVLGLEALARQRVSRLDRASVRAVALAEALTSPQVKVLGVEEPLVGMDPRAVGRVPEALRAKAKNGCAVVVATSSVRDATELGDDFTLLRSGLLAAEASSPAALAALGGHGGTMTVLARTTTDARSFASALAVAPEVQGFELRAPCVWVHGPDPVALSRAVGRAAVEAQVDLLEVRADSETGP